MSLRSHARWFVSIHILLLGTSMGCSSASSTPGSSPGGASAAGSAGAIAGGPTATGSSTGGGGAGGSGGALATAGTGGSAGAAGGGTAGGGGSGGAPAIEPPAPPGAWVTTADLAQKLASANVTMGDSGAVDAAVTLDLGITYQVMNGFGAAITDSSSYVMTRYLSSDALKDVMMKLFDTKDGIGINLLRQPMGASDFTVGQNFSYDDTPEDTTLSHFNLDQDMKATIPVLKQALAINPAIFVLGTPWSAPAWMKGNNSMGGSGSGSPGNPWLNGSAYEPFARYFVKFVQGYAAQGITVSAVAPQNEPLHDDSGFPEMGLDAASETKFVGQNLGPAFEAADLSTQIWAYDHNWDQEEYPETVVKDAAAGPFTSAAAFHCYGGDPSAMTTFHQHLPQTAIYMTECSGGGWQDDPWSSTINLIIDSTNNWAQGVALWNMALDEKNGPINPNSGSCTNCRPVVTVNTKGTVDYTVDYYALGHFSKFVRPGAKRVASKTSNGNLSIVAFQNTDGRIAVIGHNTGGSTLRVRVGTGASALNASVPATAGVTFAWTPAP